MTKQLGLAALMIVMAAWPALGDDEGGVTERPTIAFRPAVIDAVDRVIIPGYEALAEAADAEAQRVDDLCWQADAERLAGAREGFGALVLAWSSVEMFRFGPVRDDNRYERLFFWPDPRGRGLQQVQGILADKDATATAVETLRDKSVAVQGLSALEFVLFGTGSDALANAPDPDRSFRCRYGATIAGAIALTAREIVDHWSSETGFGDLIRQAGPDNPVYRSHGEVVQELIKSCGEQVQLDQQLKLAFTDRRDARQGQAEAGAVLAIESDDPVNPGESRRRGFPVRGGRDWGNPPGGCRLAGRLARLRDPKRRQRAGEACRGRNTLGDAGRRSESSRHACLHADSARRRGRDP